jgi:hypothetical protein
MKYIHHETSEGESDNSWRMGDSLLQWMMDNPGHQTVMNTRLDFDEM